MANQRVHSWTRRRAVDLPAEERLTALPARDVWMACVAVEAVVTRDGFVSVEANHYGMAWTHAGQTVEARVLTRTVEVWANGFRIAAHPRQGGIAQTLLLPGQLERAFR